MNKYSESNELLSLVRLVYGPPDPNLGEDRRLILEEQIRRRLWQLDEGRRATDCDAATVRSATLPQIA